jgi:hypothetical protein
VSMPCSRHDPVATWLAVSSHLSRLCKVAQRPALSGSRAEAEHSSRPLRTKFQMSASEPVNVLNYRSR